MDAGKWNEFIATHGPRSGAFLQSWDWGEFYRTLGRQVIRVSIPSPESQVPNPSVLAQLLEYPIRAGFFSFDLPRGPIGPVERIPAAIEISSEQTKKTGALFLHVELSTPVPAGTGVPTGTRYVKTVPAASHQPQQTLLLNLSQTEDELLTAMHEKTRYNIRLAERKGVVVSVENDADVFWRLLTETTKRDEFSPHAKSYYKTLLRTLQTGACQAQLFVARYQNQPLAALVAVSFGHTTTYLHGASSDVHRNVMAPHLLQWRAIQDAKRRGIRWYDFWGIDEARWPGVTRFKLGFGGERESYPPAFDLPLRKFWYRMYRLGQKIT